MTDSIRNLSLQTVRSSSRTQSQDCCSTLFQLFIPWYVFSTLLSIILPFATGQTLNSWCDPKGPLTPASFFFFFFYWITLEFGATNCDCFYWECDTITWCIFSMIVWVFSFWLLLLHSGFFHYHINWLGGEQTVPQQILLKDCFFFPLSRIRRYQHTVMNTSLDVVAKILDHCWSQVWDMQRRTIHHDILKYKRFFLGGKTRNRGGWGGNTLTSNTSWKAVAGSDSVAFIRALFYNPFPFLFAFPSSIYTLA